ncbi:MAG TPA: HNH endonuclease [Clostridiales bacterium]|nr:HNH endonuclease [Clostridiales bacterium]
MRARTKALAISRAVKEKVLERDKYCVWCGRPGIPNAHFIPRSQGGLGIEENVLTLCPECHRKYDHTTERKKMQGHFRIYLRIQYPDWDENKLYYKKGG